MQMAILKEAFIQSLIQAGELDAAKLVKGGLFIRPDFKKEKLFNKAIVASGIPNRFKVDLVYKEIFSEQKIASA